MAQQNLYFWSSANQNGKNCLKLTLNSLQIVMVTKAYVFFCYNLFTFYFINYKLVLTKFNDNP